MAGHVPTDLDKKYMLLSACFPGIQARKLTQKRYLEKKEEIRRSNHVGMGRKGSLPELPPLTTALPGVKQPHRSLGDDQLDRSFFHPRTRPQNASVDLTCHTTEQPASLTRLKPCVSSLWNRKLSTVQKKLRDIDQVRRNIRKTL